MNKTLTSILVILVVAVLGFIFYSSQSNEKNNESAMGEKAVYMVVVRNVHDSQPLSPGVYALHTNGASLNFLDGLSPSALEPLAEYGSNTAFAEFVRGTNGVIDTITIDAPILPGEQASFEVMADSDELSKLYLSGIMMLVGTNDGYALLDAIRLSEVGSRGLTLETANYDNGTEENEAPGGGFDAGQPDPSRGEENVENGTPTNPQRPVARHAQITETVMEVLITAK